MLRSVPPTAEAAAGNEDVQAVREAAQEPDHFARRIVVQLGRGGRSSGNQNTACVVVKNPPDRRRAFSDGWGVKVCAWTPQFSECSPPALFEYFQALFEASQDARCQCRICDLSAVVVLLNNASLNLDMRAGFNDGPFDLVECAGALGPFGVVPRASITRPHARPCA